MVSGEAPPPDADTRHSPSLLPKRMMPSVFQVPVGVTGSPTGSPTASARRIVLVPARSRRRSLPPTENAIEALSGDHVGKLPPLVPGSARTVEESNGRSHRFDWAAPFA